MNENIGQNLTQLRYLALSALSLSRPFQIERLSPWASVLRLHAMLAYLQAVAWTSLENRNKSS
jgi:hypothetical protein